jgi:hypothetical protein
MSAKKPFARIAITLPPDDLAAADRLATREDRSRSWIIAEAIRQYVTAQERRSARLDPSRREQVRRDLALTPAARIHEADATSAWSGEHVEPRRFSSFDAFLAWQRDRHVTG